MQHMAMVRRSSRPFLWAFPLLLGVLANAPLVAQPWAVEGRVLDAEGQPLRAVVELVPATDPLALAERQRSGEELPPLDRTRTTADGRFRLEVRQPGAATVKVRARHHLGARYDLGPVFHDRPLDDIQLERGSSMELQLIDPGGSPAFGLELTARPWSVSWRQASRRGWWPETRRAITDERGIVTLVCAPGEQLGLVAATAEWILHQRVDCAPGERIDLKPTGHWLPAQIEPEVLGVEGSLLGFYRWPLVAFGHSDAEGILWLPVADLGTIPIWLVDDAGSFGEPAVGRDPETPDVLLFEMPENVVVEGQVVDALSGAPIPKAWVWLGRGAHLFRQTDDAGRFRLRLPHSETDRLQVGAVGYALLQGPRPSEIDGPLELALEPSWELHGQVTDPWGEPLADVELTLVEPLPQAEMEEGLALVEVSRSKVLRRSRSGADGRFHWRGLGHEPELVLTATLEGYRQVETHLSAADTASRDPRQILLEPARRFEGVVVDEDDRPLRGATVELLEALQGVDASRRQRVGERHRTQSGAEGAYTLFDVAPGFYYLVASAPGYPEVAVPGIGVEPGDAPMDLGTLVLVPGVALAGKVLDTDGEGVVGARLSLRRADGAELLMAREGSTWFAGTSTLQDGSYRFEGLPAPSRLVVLATADGHLPWQEEVDLGEDGLDLEISLTAGGFLSGWVVGPDGAAVSNARVVARVVRQDWDPAVAGRARDLGLDSRQIRSDAEGAYRLGPLPTGRYRVQAAGGGRGTSLAQEIEIDGSGLDGLVLEMQEPGSLHGRVVDRQGQGIAAATVQGWLEGFGLPFHDRQVLTDADGVFAVDSLARGTYRLMATHAGYAAGSPVRVDVGDGGTPVELVLGDPEDAQGRVRGRVVDANGEPVGYARLFVAVVPPVWGVTDPAGDFTLEVPLGPIRLQASHPDHGATLSESIEVGVAGVDGIELQLEEASGRIVGQIEGLELESLARLSVVAQGGFQRTQGTVSFDGQIRFEDLAPGRWLVEARLGDAGRRVRQWVNLEPGVEEADVTLRFAPGHRVSGWALRGGVPLQGGLVTIRCDDGSRAEGRVGVDGRFSLPDVAEAACVARLRDTETGEESEQALDVVGDVETQLDLELDAVPEG